MCIGIRNHLKSFPLIDLLPELADDNQIESNLHRLGADVPQNIQFMFENRNPRKITGGNWWKKEVEFGNPKSSHQNDLFTN